MLRLLFIIVKSQKKLKLIKVTTVDATLCQPRLQQYFCWWQFFFLISKIYYSVLKFFTGFAIAALID